MRRVVQRLAAIVCVSQSLLGCQKPEASAPDPQGAAYAQINNSYVLSSRNSSDQGESSDTVRCWAIGDGYDCLRVLEMAPRGGPAITYIAERRTVSDLPPSGVLPTSEGAQIDYTCTFHVFSNQGMTTVGEVTQRASGEQLTENSYRLGTALYGQPWTAGFLGSQVARYGGLIGKRFFKCQYLAESVSLGGPSAISNLHLPQLD